MIFTLRVLMVTLPIILLCEIENIYYNNLMGYPKSEILSPERTLKYSLHRASACDSISLILLGYMHCMEVGQGDFLLAYMIKMKL